MKPDPIQAAILWALAARDPQPALTETLFEAMYERGCFEDSDRTVSRIDFVHNLLYLEVVTDQIESDEDHCWLTEGIIYLTPLTNVRELSTFKAWRLLWHNQSDTKFATSAR